MHKASYLMLAGSLMMSTLTGCIDDDYDLSDIDTTVQVQVKDLTVPVNLDKILLKNILKPDSGSSLKELDGEYAVVQTGSISSDPVSIAAQRVAAPTVEPTVREIFQSDDLPDDLPAEPTEEIRSYDMVDIMGDFSYTKNDIPGEILAIRNLGVEWTISIKVSVADPDNQFRSLAFRDVVINLPKGLTTSMSGYDSKSGDLTVGSIDLPAGVKEYTLSVPVSAVDLTDWAADEFSFTPGVNGGKGTVKFAGHVGVKSGEAVVTILVGGTDPSSVFLTMAPTLSEIFIDRFSGRVQYTFSNFNVPSVNISDLPDLLTDENTDIILSNPQLYLSVNNPVANYGLDAQTGLDLTPVRNGVDGKVCTLNPGQSIAIGHDKGVAGPYTFCVSPSKPAEYYQGCAGATHVGCADFAKILSGDGIPTQIKVDLPGAQVVPGDVENFKLGESLGKIDGDYTVYCPLNLSTGSKLVYSDTIDGWNDETVDRIVISDLSLSCTLNNGLPFEVVLSGYPLSAGGQQSVDPKTGKPVYINEIRVPANTSTPITTSITGEVTRLDGIHFVAHAVVTDNNQVLSPDTDITLTDIIVTVSGSYTDEL